MNVYLIRHAEAQPLELSGVNADADRPLTQHGHALLKNFLEQK